MTFERVRDDVFETYGLGLAAGRAGGTAPAVFNAANEMAVDAFLEQRIPFGRIPTLIGGALDAHPGGSADDLDAILEADHAARAHVAAAC